MSRVNQKHPARNDNRALQYLALVARISHPDFPESPAVVGKVAGITRQMLHRLKRRALFALSPRAPGPRPGFLRVRYLEKQMADANAQIAYLKAQNERLSSELSKAIVVDHAFICRLILILVVLPVSFRDIQWVLACILGQKRAPSSSTISRWVRKFGLLAQSLIMRARVEVAPMVTSLMSDEIYFASTPVLVAMEPSSRAALSIERVQSCDSETWQALYADFPVLARVTSDGGSALDASHRKCKISKQLDNFHEFRNFVRSCISKLEHNVYTRIAYEESCAQTLREAKLPSDIARAKRHLEGAKAHTRIALDDLARGLKAFRLLRKAYQPLSASGQLKSRKQADASIHEAIAILEEGQHALLTTVTNHLTKWKECFTTYLEAFDEIPLLLTPRATLSERELLSILAEFLHWEQRLEDMDFWSDYPAWRSARRKNTRRFHILCAQCDNLPQVTELFRKKLRLLERSSSPLEALNRVLRKLQRVSLDPSDAQLNLTALEYNMRPRASSHPCGADSPYRMLGASFAQEDISFVDLLLKEAGIVPSSQPSSTDKVEADPQVDDKGEVEEQPRLRLLPNTPHRRPHSDDEEAIHPLTDDCEPELIAA